MWQWNSVETLWQDVRYGLRVLVKSPAFTIVAVITLALGIGANSAIFSVLDAVLLRLLPVKAPEQLVVLTDPDSHGRSYGAEGGDRSLLCFSEFQYLHDHNDVFSGVFAFDSEAPKLEVSVSNSSSGVAEEPETARVQLVSGDYFSVLGVSATVGRTFTREVDRARGGSPVAVISYPFWKERFNFDPAVLGKSIRIHQTTFEVVGVAPPRFFGTTVWRRGKCSRISDKSQEADCDGRPKAWWCTIAFYVKFELMKRLLQFRSSLRLLGRSRLSY